jgi:prophage antirepressor-like protein
MVMQMGYSNGRDAVAKHVRDNEKATVAIRDSDADGVQRPRNVTIISQSGALRLCMKSNAPIGGSQNHPRERGWRGVSRSSI